MESVNDFIQTINTIAVTIKRLNKMTEYNEKNQQKLCIIKVIISGLLHIVLPSLQANLLAAMPFPNIVNRKTFQADDWLFSHYYL